MEIISNLWQVGGAGLTAVEDAAIYLARFGDQAFLVDAGCGFGHRKLVKNVAEVLPAETNIAYLFLTQQNNNRCNQQAENQRRPDAELASDCQQKFGRANAIATALAELVGIGNPIVAGIPEDIRQKYGNSDQDRQIRL